jgi:hypothetical protein
MVPPVCRLLIVLASLAVPRPGRKAWKQEWYAELSYRQRCGASLRYLLRSSSGSFRDAVWLRRQTPVDFRFMTAPLRAETFAVIAALLICLWTSALVPARPEFSNLDRLVRYERDMHFMGAVNQFIWPPFLKIWRGMPGIEQVASYRLRTAGRIRYGQVSLNFFRVLGVKEPYGRSLAAGDDSRTALITHEFWRTALNSDVHAVGKTFQANGKTYTTVGILSPNFAFNRCSFFVPLGSEPSYFAIALLKPGVTRQNAEADLVKVTQSLVPRWRYGGTRLESLISPFTLTSVFMSGAIAMLGVAYLLLRYRMIFLYTGTRIAVLLLSLTAMNLATARPIGHFLWLLSMLQFWVFIGLCSAVVYFVLKDQNSRCPTCLERLRMPVQFGSWSSLILDRPATEYVCPSGHGALFVSEALHDPNQWTEFDESWHDLFAETTTH